MRILIPVFSPATGTWGGLTRVIAMAEAGQKAGHQVAFCASGELRSRLQKRGYSVYPVPAPTMFGLPKSLSRIVEKRSQQTALPIKPRKDFGSIWFVLLLSGMARTSFLHRLVEAERSAARNFRPDFVFTDLDPGAFLLAEICGLPIAAAYQTPMQVGIGSFAWKFSNRAARLILERYGCSPMPIHTLFHGPQVLKIIPSIPELEGTEADRPDVRYVGQLLGNIEIHGKFQADQSKRYIFVYLGTGAIPLGTVRRILPKVFPNHGKYICLVAAQSINGIQRKEGVIFQSYVPAAEVLPHCDWVICHAGQNTIIESLVNRVPLMLFPGPIFERRFNARKVQICGAGMMGEANEFHPEWIETALEKKVPCSVQAGRLSDRIHSYGGAAAAVEAMEGWARR